MSTSNNEDSVRRLLDGAWNRGRLDLLDDLVSKDAVPSAEHGPPGPETWKSDILFYRESFSELEYAIDDMISNENYVVVRWSARAVDSVGFLGGVPSGREVSFSGITIYKFLEGKIIDHWAEFDLAGLLLKLGTISVGY